MLSITNLFRVILLSVVSLRICEQTFQEPLIFQATLNINHNIALFNENGILIPSQTIQANGVQDGDTVGILYVQAWYMDYIQYSLSGLEMLDLRDIQIIGATRKSRFTDLLRVSASGVIHRLLLSCTFSLCYMIQFHFVSYLMFVVL